MGLFGSFTTAAVRRATNLLHHKSVLPGMKIKTDTPFAKKAREGVMMSRMGPNNVWCEGNGLQPQANLRNDLGHDRFLQNLHSSMQERTTKFGYHKVCLGSSFAERNRMKMHFFHSGTTTKMRSDDKSLNLPTRTRSSIGYNYRYSHLSYCCASSYQFRMKKRIKNKMKRKVLPTHYLEVSYRTLTAVVFYGPSIDHMPHSSKYKALSQGRVGPRKRFKRRKTQLTRF